MDQTRKVRRKTIGGVDFEGITAFQAGEYNFTNFNNILDGKKKHHHGVGTVTSIMPFGP